MKKTIMVLIFSSLCMFVMAQPFTDEEIKWLRMVNDEQAFAEFPGFREIKEYQTFFGSMVKEQKLSDEEIDFVGLWGIPNGILQNEKKGLLNIPANESKFRQVLNGSFMAFFPDRILLIKYFHYDRYFPLRALIGKWKIENNTLYGKVERIILVKVPLKVDEKGPAPLKPEDFIEKETHQDWRVLLSEVNTSYDKKLRYLYKPLNPLLTKEDIDLNFDYSPEPIRESAFSAEKFFYRFYLRSEYIKLQDYLKGKIKVWDYIGTEVHL